MENNNNKVESSKSLERKYSVEDKIEKEEEENDLKSCKSRKSILKNVKKFFLVKFHIYLKIIFILIEWVNWAFVNSK